MQFDPDGRICLSAIFCHFDVASSETEPAECGMTRLSAATDDFWVRAD
jgi:hypothetical protein